MLKNFFQLNPKFRKFTTEGELSDHFAISDSLKDVLYEPDCWPADLSKVKRKRFENVSLSKTAFFEATFTHCDFVDCLFIGCEFKDVEFHGCTFVNCKFYKVEFKGCYLDPRAISLDNCYKKTHANMGVTLFQRIFADASEKGQAEFSRNADIFFRRWQRAQLEYYLLNERITKNQYWMARIKSVIADLTSSFGYSPFKFFLWTVALFFLVSFMNYNFIGDGLSIDGATGPLSFVDSVFYTFSILTVLGFSVVSPVTSAAKILTVFEALAAIGWLGIFTSILVKRFLR